eukprot:70926_1
MTALIFILLHICLSFAQTTLDLSNFEDNVLPKYIDQYTLNFDKGEFSYTTSKSDKTPSIYGITDIIHTLYIVDQISVYLSNTTIKNAWIKKIHSFQNQTGFYKLESQESSAGYQPWHSTAYTTASLYVLNAQPKYNNSYYANIAMNKSLWNPTFYSLLNYTEGKEQGCTSIHGCCHKIVGIPATIVGEGNEQKYNDFIQWWFNDFIAPNLNPLYGVLCPQQDIENKGIGVCLGSGAAVHFFDKFTNTPYPLAVQVMNFVKSLQNNSTSNCPGLWNPSCSLSGDADMDGITQYTNAAYQIQFDGWNTTVKQECENIMNFYVPRLNNESYVLHEMTKNTHKLPGIVAAVGQCNMYFPQLVKTKHNWLCCAPFM